MLEAPNGTRLRIVGIPQVHTPLQKPSVLPDIRNQYLSLVSMHRVLYILCPLLFHIYQKIKILVEFQLRPGALHAPEEHVTQQAQNRKLMTNNMRASNNCAVL